METNIYKQRLLDLAAFLDKLPESKFEFSQWGILDSSSCLTKGCALGWAAQMPQFQELGLKLYRPSDYMIASDPSMDFYLKIPRIGLEKDICQEIEFDELYYGLMYNACEDIFDLSEEETKLLFIPVYELSPDELDWIEDKFGTNKLKELGETDMSSPKNVANNIRYLVNYKYKDV